MVEGGMKCVKYLLFAFNLIFVLAGIALIAVGAYVQLALKNYHVGLNEFSAAAALLIAIGVLIFFIAFFGCCGAIRENRICILVFATLLVIIFILEIAGAIAGFVVKNKAKESLRAYMKDHLDIDDIFWKEIQTNFQCCGIDSKDDWNKTSLPSQNNFPSSCCRNQIGCNYTSADVYSEGCLEKLVTCLQKNIGYVAGVALGFAFIQVVGITFACCLAVAIKKEYEVV